MSESALVPTVDGELVVPSYDKLPAKQRTLVHILADGLTDTVREAAKLADFSEQTSKSWVYQIVATAKFQRALADLKQDKARAAVNLERDGLQDISEGSKGLSGWQRFQAGATKYKLALERASVYGPETDKAGTVDESKVAAEVSRLIAAGIRYGLNCPERAEHWLDRHESKHGRK